MAQSRGFTISTPGIERDDSEQLVVSEPGSSILSPLLFGGFWIVMAIVLAASGQSVLLLIAFVPLALGANQLIGKNYRSRLVLDFNDCSVGFSTNYLLRAPRKLQFRQAFADGLNADLVERGGLNKGKSVVLTLANGLRIVMPFDQVMDAENVVMRVNRLRRAAMEQALASDQQLSGGQWVITSPAADAVPVDSERNPYAARDPYAQVVAGSAASGAVPAEAEAVPAEAGETAGADAAGRDESFIARQQANQRAALRAQLAVQLRSRVQSWVVWLVIIAVMQLASNFESGWLWAALLLLVAGMSLVFKDSVLFIVYGVTMAWAGLENLLFAQEVLWKGFSLLQFYWCFQMVQDFRRFHKLEQVAAEPSADPNRPMPVSPAGHWFPWLSISLGGVALLCIAGSIVALIFSTAMETTLINEQQFGILFEGGIYLGVLGLATGVGAWAAGFPYRFVAIIGTVISAITLTGTLVLSLL